MRPLPLDRNGALVRQLLRASSPATRATEELIFNIPPDAALQLSVQLERPAAAAQQMRTGHHRVRGQVEGFTPTLLLT